MCQSQCYLICQLRARVVGVQGITIIPLRVLLYWHKSVSLFKSNYVIGGVMKLRFLAVASLLTLSVGVQAATDGLETLDQRVSYIVGMQIGTQLKQQGIPVDEKTLFSAISEAFSGKPPRMTRQDMQAAMTEFQEKQQVQMQKIAESNHHKGQAFLDENKLKKGVNVTASGLQYKVLTAGTGAKPKETDKVSVNYRGTLIDGTEFDSSYKLGAPASFAVNGVIKGWQEALQLMPVGSKWQVVIPSELAYGPRGAGADIGPNAVLVFEVELLSIDKE